MKAKQPKPVKAWALAFDGVPGIHWIYPTKKELLNAWEMSSHEPGETAIRVEIRPLPKRMRTRGKWAIPVEMQKALTPPFSKRRRKVARRKS